MEGVALAYQLPNKQVELTLCIPDQSGHLRQSNLLQKKFIRDPLGKIKITLERLAKNLNKWKYNLPKELIVGLSDRSIALEDAAAGHGHVKDSSSVNADNSSICNKLEVVSDTATGNGYSGNVMLLDESGLLVDDITSNEKALLSLGKFIVVDGLGKFRVLVDFPVLKQVTFRGYGIVGCPVVPITQQHFTKSVSLRWTWYVKDHESEPDGRVVGKEKVYIPKPADAGLILSVTCCTTSLLINSSADWTASLPVLPSPDRSATCLRQARFHEAISDFEIETSNKNCSTKCFSVVSYNILADRYCRHRQKTGADYDPTDVRVLNYRLPLLLEEVKGYRAEIICLQEMDEKAWSTWQELFTKEPHFMRGNYSVKSGEGMTEGCAILWKVSRFEQCSFEVFCYRDKFLEMLHGNSLPEWLKHLVETVPNIKYSLERVNSIAQICLLEDRISLRKVFVVNTHAYYRPEACSIRVIQMKLLYDYLRVRLDDNRDAALLLCGDMNAQSFDMPMRFLMNGVVSSSDPSWAASSKFVFDEKQSVWDNFGHVQNNEVLSDDRIANTIEEMTNIFTPFSSEDDISLQSMILSRLHGERNEQENSLSLKLADMLYKSQKKCETVRTRGLKEAHGFIKDKGAGVGATLHHFIDFVSAYNFPPFTTASSIFLGDIDWILFDKGTLDLVAVAGIPPLEVVTANIGLPSPCFPSDHLSLCCSLRWK